MGFWRVHLLLSEILLNIRIRYLVLSETTGFFCGGNASLFETMRDPDRRRYPLLETMGDPDRRRYSLSETIKDPSRRRFPPFETMGDGGKPNYLM